MTSYDAWKLASPDEAPEDFLGGYETFVERVWKQTDDDLVDVLVTRSGGKPGYIIDFMPNGGHFADDAELAHYVYDLADWFQKFAKHLEAAFAKEEAESK